MVRPGREYCRIALTIILESKLVASNEVPFPHLNSTNHWTTSPHDQIYNFIAWAIGLGPDEQECWWRGPVESGFTWPDDVPREVSVNSFVHALETLSFRKCDDGKVERGFEKIALYTKDDTPTHLARQLPDGKWTSKLGIFQDITHTTPKVLEGPEYGCVKLFMRRERE